MNRNRFTGRRNSARRFIGNVDREPFCLTVQSDSLAPELLRGDVVRIDPHADILPGALVWFAVGNEPEFARIEAIAADGVDVGRFVPFAAISAMYRVVGFARELNIADAPDRFETALGRGDALGFSDLSTAALESARQFIVDGETVALREVRAWAVLRVIGCPGGHREDATAISVRTGIPIAQVIDLESDFRAIIGTA